MLLQLTLDLSWQKKLLVVCCVLLILVVICGLKCHNFFKIFFIKSANFFSDNTNSLCISEWLCSNLTLLLKLIFSMDICEIKQWTLQSWYRILKLGQSYCKICCVLNRAPGTNWMTGKLGRNQLHIYCIQISALSFASTTWMGMGQVAHYSNWLRAGHCRIESW